jgi:lipopolysaccharide transport system ATP-binding protein
MSDVIIQAENVGKKYRLRHQSVRGYRTLREVITEKAKGFLKKPSSNNGNGKGSSVEEFWALQGVSFEIKRGDVVGIIGRNGAGKSTLLKVLSRITEPTTGRIRISGRVASLLEVGTGFHPELTGRENIYLNGAILGMTRVEIKSKFDEIVAFAEVEKFLDTPVKRYSSGMYVRLAFAVAAHLEPEILIVDEVLAVGDATFQKKCLGRMSEVARGGRTVFFVSHNLNAVESLCSRALLLEKGCLKDSSSDVRAVITGYLSGANGQGAIGVWSNSNGALSHPCMKPLYFAIEDSQGRPLNVPVRNDQPLFVVIRADIRQLDPSLNLGFALFNQDSQVLLWSLTTDGPEERWPKLAPGLNEFRCALPPRFLNEGAYRLELNCSLHCRDWFIQPGRNSPCVHFEIQGGLSDSPYWTFARPGIFAPEWAWKRTIND